MPTTRMYDNSDYLKLWISIAADAITLKKTKLVTTVDENWSRLLCNGMLWEYAGIQYNGGPVR